MSKRRMPKDVKYAHDRATLRKWLRRGKRRIRRLERREGKKDCAVSRWL